MYESYASYENNVMVAAGGVAGTRSSSQLLQSDPEYYAEVNESNESGGNGGSAQTYSTADGSELIYARKEKEPQHYSTADGTERMYEEGGGAAARVYSTADGTANVYETNQIAAARHVTSEA